MTNYYIYFILNFFTLTFSNEYSIDFLSENLPIKQIHKNLNNDCVLFASNIDYILESKKALLNIKSKKILFIEYSFLNDKFNFKNYGHAVLVWQREEINGVFISDETGTILIKENIENPNLIAQKIFPLHIIHKAYYIN